MAKEGTQTVLIFRKGARSGFRDDATTEAVGECLNAILYPRANYSLNAGVTTRNGLNIYFPADGIEWLDTVPAQERFIIHEDSFETPTSAQHVGIRWILDGTAADWYKPNGTDKGQTVAVDHPAT